MNSKYITIVLCLLWGILPLQSQTNTKKQPSLEEIGTSAFQGATIEQGMILPASLKSIGNNAFQNVTIPCMNFTKCINLEQIRPNAFNSTSLTKANVLDFTNSSKLRCYISGTQSGSSFANFSGEVILPREVVMALHKNSLKTIAESAFENSTIGSIDFLGCSNLEEISINAFRNMKLTENTRLDLSVISKLSTIGNTVFQKSNITKLLLPDSLKYIGNSTFSDCVNLNAITSYSPSPPLLGTTVFTGVNTKICKLLVPETSLSRYGTTAQWEDFLRILIIGSDPEEECEDTADIIESITDASGNKIRKEIVLTQSSNTTIQSFSDEIANHKITITPDITKKQIIIEILETTGVISVNMIIVNLRGQTVSKRTGTQKQINLDISNEPAGIYILHIKINGETSSWKIIK